MLSPLTTIAPTSTVCTAEEIGFNFGEYFFAAMLLPELLNSAGWLPKREA